MPYTIDPTRPLLKQARARLAAARDAENAARIAWDADRANPLTQQAVTDTAQEARRALEWRDQIERSCAALPTAEADADRDLLREESAYDTLVETHRRAEAQQWRRVEQARAQLERLRTDKHTLTG